MTEMGAVPPRDTAAASVAQPTTSVAPNGSGTSPAAVSGRVTRNKIARDAGVGELAEALEASIGPTGVVEEMLADEMAAAHNAAMRLIRAASMVRKPAEMSRLTHASARMMEAFRETALVLHRLRTGGRQLVTVQHVTVGPGGQAVVAATIDPGGRSAGAGKIKAMDVPREERANERRGWLRNNNPVGDYMKAPRCGARNRRGLPCRCPAMRNGRCRLHGGLSTGPKTPEGLERCRTSRLTHGYYSQTAVEQRRRERAETRDLIRRMRALSSELEQIHRDRQGGNWEE